MCSSAGAASAPPSPQTTSSTCVANELSSSATSPVPEALVTDFYLPHADGLAVGRYARSRRRAMPIIMVTGYPQSLQAAVDPLDHPPIVLLTKPLDYPELLRRLATALGVPAAV